MTLSPPAFSRGLELPRWGWGMATAAVLDPSRVCSVLCRLPSRRLLPRLLRGDSSPESAAPLSSTSGGPFINPRPLHGIHLLFTYADESHCCCPVEHGLLPYSEGTVLPELALERNVE